MNTLHPTFQNICESFGMTEKPANQAILYRGYIIETDKEYPYSLNKFICYPAEQGIDHDYDYDGDGYQYSGNCLWASTVDEAKELIWEKVMTSISQHKVVMNGRDYYFDWIEDAIKFAVQWNAEEFIPAVNQ